MNANPSQAQSVAVPCKVTPLARRTAGSPKAVPVILGAPVIAWQSVFFAAPLVFLLVVTFWTVRSFKLQPAFSFDNWQKVLLSTPFQRALVYTAEVSALCAILTLLIALPVAYTIAFRLPRRLRDMAVAALVVPVFSSYLLRIYAWQIVLSPDGIINSLTKLLLDIELPLLGGQFSLQVGLLTATLPVAVLILVLAFSGVDRNLIEAAANLGCRRARILWHVLLPSTRNAVLLSASTAFLMSFGDYISPVFLTGSKPPTLSILIVDTVKSGSQWPRASVIGVSMLAILIVVLAAFNWLGRERRSIKGGH
ncbi:ABC transporter permease (plasmid) [Agrobacterium tumefaciens]|uniref:ABC transporter permease n=1 Tax=Agrobacterium tumefaciens TaxID=358 RepID=UPI001573C89D|nr:ABC transporter permease [Agrobacterium tumefaciens]NSZ66100.1 ABC transporter permease [Agrobacterium tumefaciens]NTA72471.1 ABC transporter permease [Agrobacterium tumefaciens]WIE41713.1 ABC transporter permease [Agrobacterium tumefaciens]